MISARRTTAAGPVRAGAATAVVLATAGGLLTTVATVPASAATVTCASPTYKRQFFANTTFSGTPKKTDCDTTIAENWGAGAPATGLPKDNFGVRWTVTRDFGSGGPFTFTAAAQDGIRVYLDGKAKVNLWKNVTTTQKKTVDLTIPAGKHTIRVDHANFTGNANVNFAYTPRTSATVDKVEPLTPTGTALTYDNTTGKARLTWAKNKEMDLAGYRIYRSLSGSPFGTPLATASATATTYTDSAVPNTGATYAYEIRAYDKAGNQSAGSADLTATTVDKTAPAQVTGVRVTVTASNLRLDWNPVADAFSYSLYRASAPQGPYARINWAIGDTFIYDNTGDVKQRAYYRVTAVDKYDNESVPSATVDPGVPDTTAPDQVTGLTAQGTTAGNAVRWQASSADVERYEVWTSTAGQADPDGPDIALATSFNDEVAEPGVPVTYTIQAVDAYGNISPVSETVTATRPAPGESAVPTNLSGTLHDSDTELDWDYPTDNAPSDYRVYRRTGTNDAWTRISEGDDHWTRYSRNGLTFVRYADTAAPLGRASYYLVALDQHGDESTPTGIVTVTRGTPATATAPAPPTMTLSAPYTECTANDCVAHGGSNTPLTMTLTPDPDRLIWGYEYRFTGDSGYTRTPDATIAWTPPASGTYTFEVRAVDYYMDRTGAAATILFKVG
ncbi:fibronectin type III domain-containing protein [Streptomyces sp. WI04-05B]|uniref:fibronectin type III domain-containing protein n=1 Tax=Streptomyces TaxID=1883 RepID=UPI0029BF598B|nr:MULTISPECIES: PA14 domain-containing protein [unclassified Streptomyces]MDX2543219.1 PA14 domain-containing protein [Streptomyces sp. WI04-05B]MDX2584740.1 PA14 domain-containing protein [Streptomyces sp. WI04-05A]